VPSGPLHSFRRLTSGCVPKKQNNQPTRRLYLIYFDYVMEELLYSVLLLTFDGGVILASGVGGLEGTGVLVSIDSLSGERFIDRRKQTDRGST